VGREESVAQFVTLSIAYRDAGDCIRIQLFLSPYENEGAFENLYWDL